MTEYEGIFHLRKVLSSYLTVLYSVYRSPQCVSDHFTIHFKVVGCSCLCKVSKWTFAYIYLYIWFVCSGFQHKIVFIEIEPCPSQMFYSTFTSLHEVYVFVGCGHLQKHYKKINSAFSFEDGMGVERTYF